MLQEHEMYVHLPTDTEYQNMTASEVHAKLRCYNITVPDNITTASLVPRPFPAPVLIACSIKTEGKAWESHVRDVR